MTPRVKICGITSLDDALAAVDAGADALGFNFYAKSPRSVSLARAAAIVQKLPPFIATVAVWVEPGEAELRQALGACRWGSMQFHGEELDDALMSIPKDLRILGVALKDKRGLTALKHRPACAAYLVDASVKGLYGGTGKLARWDLAASLAKQRRVILAGGLTPENVAAAVQAVKPYAVDTASGVESAPGKKSAVKMKAFVAAAKATLKKG